MPRIQYICTKKNTNYLSLSFPCSLENDNATFQGQCTQEIDCKGIKGSHFKWGRKTRLWTAFDTKAVLNWFCVQVEVYVCFWGHKWCEEISTGIHRVDWRRARWEGEKKHCNLNFVFLFTCLHSFNKQSLSHERLQRTWLQIPKLH